MLWQAFALAAILTLVPQSLRPPAPVPDGGGAVPATLASDIVRLPSGELIRSDRLLVKWDPASPISTRLARYASLGARLVRALPQIGWDVVAVDQDRLRPARDSLLAVDGVRRCDFSRAYRPAYLPNDPLYSSMWAPPRIHADAAWDTTQGSSQVVIAILDTGLDINHIDLDDNIWTNPGEIPGNGVDDDANGYIDDIVGYDFSYDDPDPDDNHGHGTGCAGIAAAEIDNLEGIVGIGPGCRLMACKCGRDDGYFFDDAVAPAFLYAADMGAKVTSNSYYGDGVTPIQSDAVAYAYEHGVLNVVAAGNDDRVTLYYPAGFDACLAVASLEPDGTKSWFSNYGTWVDVLAPGNGLLTTYVGDNYGGFAGTSGACPHVSGLAGLLFSLHPDWSPDEVRARINNTCEPFDDPVVGPTANYGVVDCDAAVKGRPSPSRPHASLVWVSPIAAPANAGVKVVGRSLDTHAGFVSIGSVNAPITAWSNERVRTVVPGGTPGGGMHRGLSISSRNGRLSFDPFRVLAPGAAPVYAATDISINGNYSDSARLSGGFTQMLALDGDLVTGTSRSDGVAAMDAVFQNLEVPLGQQISLDYTRGYDAATGSAVEHLYLYDFDSGSYPYGSYVEIATFAITAGSTRTDTVTVTDNPERFRSYESNVFLAIRAETGVGNSGFTIDQITIAAQ